MTGRPIIPGWPIIRRRMIPGWPIIRRRMIQRRVPLALASGFPALRNRKVMFARILASDLDGTLIPPEASPDHQSYIEEFASFFGSQRSAVLAYVTGRDVELALDGIRCVGLPEPDFLSCDVGKTLYLKEGERYVLDSEYRSFVKTSMGDLDSRDLREALAAQFQPVKFLDETRQSEFKLSYQVDPEADWPRLLSQVRGFIEAEGGRTHLVFSVDPKAGTGLLDVLPEGVSKFSAVAHLARQAGLSNSEVVYAGDSGNDLEALLGGFKGIVVGNASMEVRNSIERTAEERGLSPELYFAEQAFAAGVLEGCRRFGLIPEA
jgi:HAD superfamily hydrolase (TIGR01484 family)